MINLGKANVQVEILRELPGITKNPSEFNFDVTSSQWDSIQKSPYFQPILAEYIEDPADGFAAIYPTKRKLYVNNYISSFIATTTQPPNQGGANVGVNIIQSLPYISWSPIGNFSKRGVVTDIAKNYKKYTLIPPGQITPSNYTGPMWDMIQEPYVPPTDDFTVIQTWAKNTTSDFLIKTIDQVGIRNKFAYPNISWIYQEQILSGLFWGVESNAFLPVILDEKKQELSSMSFCFNLKILDRPLHDDSTSETNTATTQPPPLGQAPAPAPAGLGPYNTLFIISLGLDDEQNAFDIVIQQNARPYILDYTLGRSGSGGTANIGSKIILKEFGDDLSKVLDYQNEIEVSVMTIAGRLVVWINKVCLIYTRINQEEGDNAGTISECKIASGRIAIYGSNVSAKINVCPLTYSPFAAFTIPLPTIIEGTSNDPETVSYRGVNNKMEIGGACAILPQQPDKRGKLYGVDCYNYIDDIQTIIGQSSGDFTKNTVHPNGFGFHRMGNIYFFNAGLARIAGYASSDFYVILMQSSDATPLTMPNGVQINIYHWGCPFYFRLKGGYRNGLSLPNPEPVLVPEVLSATESASAPDYFHSLTSATVVIYNKGGQYDYLKESQYGIRLSWGWGDNIVQTFTGVVVNASNSEVAGKEVLTLQCEDYMAILKNTPIVNSPFYDGMVMFYALADIAKRGGIMTCINDQPLTEKDYFLPSGYTFSKPAVRFPSNNMLFNCMIDIVKRFEAFVHFDAYGRLHVYKLPGGLFSNIPPGTIMKEYNRDPTQVDAWGVILNEKNVEYNFASTVNTISVLTVDRESRNPILFNTAAATTGEDHLMYKKTFLYNQAALGDIESCRKWTREVSKRMYYPIRKVNFSTAGNNTVVSDDVLSFIKVDGLEYRVMSISKKYDASSNDFTLEYGAEWLGGG